jgi:Caspase domain/Domain of unknown function (DUF4384)
MRKPGSTLLLGLLCASCAMAQQVQQSPLASVKNGREEAGNNRIVTTGIRSPVLPSNHALIISVSGYPRSPLPGVKEDRETATELARRFGVADENIVYLSEKEVTREGLQRALDQLDQKILPGDNLYIYYSGHGARFFNKSKKECSESLVMQNEQMVTNDEFSDMIKPLSAKADKTVVMLDSCHSGGVAEHAATRDLHAILHGPRPKYDAFVSSAECSNPVNLRSFTGTRGIQFDTTDNNLVILAAARKDEVAWDTSKGGAMTYSFLQCVKGAAVDEDHSGSVSMKELFDCVQDRLSKQQDQGTLQHLELTGNTGLVPGFEDDVPSPAPPNSQPPSPDPQPAPPDPQPQIEALAALHDLFAKRDDRWAVTVTPSSSSLKIGSDTLDLKISSNRDGYVYIFYLGTGPDSFYLLFPNQLDTQNRISAGETLGLPAPSWTVSALGPSGTDHVLVMVTETPRDLGNYALPREYVSLSGPFGKIGSTAKAAGQLNEVATLSSGFKTPKCRDLGIRARSECSNAFGAALIDIKERE